MKKLAALLLAATMCVSVTACGSSTKEDTSAADNTTAEDTAEEESASDSAASDKVFNIGICQLVQHEALDAATKGFEDALVEEFGEDGVKFDEQNAQGDSNTCSTIINGFVSNRCRSDPGKRNCIPAGSSSRHQRDPDPGNRCYRVRRCPGAV